MWREREGDPAPVAPPAAVAVQSGGGAIDPVAEGSLTQIATLDALRAHIGPACTRCKLCTQGRSQVRFEVRDAGELTVEHSCAVRKDAVGRA